MADSSGVRQPPLREAELLGRIRSGGPSVVALSGGVDSATVTALAVRALGGDVLAVTLRGPAVAREEVVRARAVAESVGVRH
ncbi:MAG TPA: asparagine synthase-related protein, partial [Thermoplasmata archaeon]|nr:asparagine synthase-related protein [Thermoplasmata archaeon]